MNSISLVSPTYRTCAATYVMIQNLHSIPVDYDGVVCIHTARYQYVLYTCYLLAGIPEHTGYTVLYFEAGCGNCAETKGLAIFIPY